MYGAFIGDIVGSKYEFNNIKTKDNIWNVNTEKEYHEEEKSNKEDAK